MSQIDPPDRAMNGFRPVGPIVPAEEIVPWFEGKAFADQAAVTLEQAKKLASDEISADKARGYEEGWQAAAKDAAALLARTQLSINTFYARLDGEVVDLVVNVLRQVLDEYEPTEALIQTVRKAIRATQLGNDLTLSVPPDLLAEVEERLAEIVPEGSSPVRVTVRASPELKGSASILSSPLGSVDLSIDKQLEILAQNLRAASLTP